MATPSHLSHVGDCGGCSSDDFFLLDDEINTDKFEIVPDIGGGDHGARSVLAQLFSEENIEGYNKPYAIEASPFSSSPCCNVSGKIDIVVLYKHAECVRDQPCPSSMSNKETSSSNGGTGQLNSIHKQDSFFYKEMIRMNVTD